MKLIAKLEDGTEVAFREIKSVDSSCRVLLLHSDYAMRPENLEKLEQVLSKKIGVKVVILDQTFKDKVTAINNG